MKVNELKDSWIFTIRDKIEIYEEILQYYINAKGTHQDPKDVFGGVVNNKMFGLGSCELFRIISGARLYDKYKMVTPFPEYLLHSDKNINEGYFWPRNKFDERIHALTEAIKLCKTR